MSNQVKLKRLHPTAVLPTHGTADSVGLDLCSSENLVIPPNDTKTVSTGWAIELPSHLEGQVRSRSGLAAKLSVHVLNSPGTIDPDYRGELKVILRNDGNAFFYVTPGMRIAQLVLAPVVETVAVEVEELSENESRGVHGFGSTGL